MKLPCGGFTSVAAVAVAVSEPKWPLFNRFRIETAYDKIISAICYTVLICMITAIPQWKCSGCVAVVL